MKNVKKLFIGVSMIAALSVNAFAGASLFNNQTKSQREVVVEAAGPGNYYDSISDSLSGKSLLNALHTLNANKTKKLVGYAGFRQFAAKSDKNPNGGNKIVGFYNNALVGPDWDGGDTWNREHMWPKSRKGSYVENDAHMVRPTATSINSERGNMLFGDELGTYDPGQYYSEYRGIAARIIFYCAIADTDLSLVDLTTDDASNGTMGKLSTLLAWNLQYLPDASSTASLALKTEQNRNEVIQNDKDGQGNRNPFIDHPEYACKIWGNTNDATRAACNGVVPDPDPVAPTSITLNYTPEDIVSINVGETVQVSVADVVPSNAVRDVTWSTDPARIASVDENGLVTGLAAGTTLVTAKSTLDPSVYAYCFVDVYQPEPEPVSPTSIELNKTEHEMTVGDTFDLKVNSVQPTDAVKTVTWESSDDTIASVSSGGNVTALKAGTVTVTATSTLDPTVKATCTFNISEPSGGDSSSETSEVTPPTSSEEPKGGVFGCAGEIMTAAIFIPVVLGFGIILLLVIRHKRKKHE